MALLPGCTGTGEAKPPQSEEQNTKLPATDRAGNEISIPDQINRIISISPANTEILIE